MSPHWIKVILSLDFILRILLSCQNLNQKRLQRHTDKWKWLFFPMQFAIKIKTQAIPMHVFWGKWVEMGLHPSFLSASGCIMLQQNIPGVDGRMEVTRCGSKYGNNTHKQGVRSHWQAQLLANSFLWIFCYFYIIHVLVLSCNYFYIFYWRRQTHTHACTTIRTNASTHT